jgi:hypothetical protein
VAGLTAEKVSGLLTFWRALAIQPDGRIVVVGHLGEESEGRRFAVARYWP